MHDCNAEETIRRLVETYSPMLLRPVCTRLSSPADAEAFLDNTGLEFAG